MKVYFTDKAIADIQNFIRASEEAFMELFTDSGIWAEEMIIQSYLANITELKKKLFQEISTRLGRTKVFGRKDLDVWKELVFHVGSRLVIIYYSENSKKNIRQIESVSIDRKPLIF
jgi:hypothetical protein